MHANDHGPSPTSKPAPLPAQTVSLPTPLAPRAQIHRPTLTPVAVNPEVITPKPEAPEVTVAELMEEFWAQALHECDSAAMKAGLWAKATYMRLRATQL